MSQNVYLSEEYNENVEFPSGNMFELERFADATTFVVIDAGMTTPQPFTPPIPSIPSTPDQGIQNQEQGFSQTSSRRSPPLAVVKVVRADICDNGKPGNIQDYNQSIVINIFRDEDACVPFVERKLQEQLKDRSLVLASSNGLQILEQAGTTGTLNFKFSIVTVEGSKIFLKILITLFGKGFSLKIKMQ